MTVDRSFFLSADKGGNNKKGAWTVFQFKGGGGLDTLMHTMTR